MNLQHTSSLAPTSSSLSAELSLASRFKGILVTSNQGKADEMGRLLGAELQAKKVDLQELQPTKLQYELMRKGEYLNVAQQIALDKAERAFRELGQGAVVVEDTSLFINENGGLPGPLVSAYEGRWDELSRCFPDSKAEAITVIAYCDSVGNAQCRVGRISGKIAAFPAGENGFGWDRVFIPDSSSQTFAQMSPSEKNDSSMRRLACDAVVESPFKIRSFISLPDVSAAPQLNAPGLSPDLEKDFNRVMKQPASQQICNSAKEAAQHWLDQMHSDLAGNTARREDLEAGHEVLPSIFGEFYADRNVSQLQDAQLLRILTERGVDLVFRNHPFRLESQIALQRAGFTPTIAPRVAAFDRAGIDRRAVTFEDFGCHPSGPIGRGAVESTTLIYGAGLWSWTSSQTVTSFTNLGSMPSTVGALSMATSALMGNLAFAPVDSLWGDVNKQEQMIRRALLLIDRDPLLNHEVNPYLEHKLSNSRTVEEQLKTRALSCLGVTLKPDLHKAVSRAEHFMKLGITSFRVYDPGATNRLAETVKLLKDKFGDQIVIFAGQVVTAKHAEEVYKAGAHSLIVGIGDGEMCSTSTRADVAAANPLVIYEITRSGVPIPVLADGGVGSKYGVLMACGGAGQLTSKGLVGGTVEQPPFSWLAYGSHSNGNPLLVKPYNGEAGSITKISGRAVDYLGRPWNLEGANGFTEFNAGSPSMVQRAGERMQGLGKALRFQGAASVVELLHRGIAPDVMLMSDAARSAAGVHHMNVLH